MDELLKQAHWSDEFFNYVPAGQDYAFDPKSGVDPNSLREAAQTFLEVNPECPYPVDWLVQDFCKRV